MTTDETADSTASGSERTMGIEWHPDALRPPFTWHVQLPPDWAVVETHPTRWKRQNERIVDDYFDGRRVPSKVRKALLRSLEDTVAAAQKKKVLLTLLRPGVTDDGKVANVALNIVFTSSSPRLASMAPVKKAFGSADSYSERTTPSGNAYGLTTVQRRQRDGDEYRNILSVQAFYPFPGTTWTLAVAVTTPQVHLEKQLTDLVIRCVSSIRVDSDKNTAAMESVGSLSDPPLIDDAISLVQYTVPK